MKSLPARNMNLPVKMGDVPHCPECGGTHICEDTIERVTYQIDAWSNKLPDKRTEIDRGFLRYDEPRYYCLSCGESFNDIDWQKGEVL